MARSFRKTVQLLGALLALVMLAAACSGGDPVAGDDPDNGDPAPPDEEPDEPDEMEFQDVSLAIPPNPGHAPAYVALELGFFAQRGLNIHRVEVAGAADVNRAFEAGEVEFAASSNTGGALGRAGGILQKTFIMSASSATTDAYDAFIGLIGSKERGIDPDDPDSLRGKKVAVNVGSGAHLYLTRWLEANGMTEDDIELVNTPVPETAPTMIQGLVDACSCYEPWFSTVQVELGDDAVTVARDEGFLSFVTSSAASDDIIESDPELVELMASALAEAAQYVRQNPDETARLLLNYIDGLQVDVAAQMLRSLVYDPRISDCVMQGFENESQSFKELGQTDVAFDRTELLYPDAIQAVEAANPEWFDDLPEVPASC